MENILISIIMPTYNSERTIAKALKSIREQDFPQECIEIIVVDGGSEDRTKEIAEEYDAVVLDNPRRVPEVAKCIGVKYAHGDWIIKQDSDEEYTENDQIKKRWNFLKKNKNVFCLVTDILEPSKSCGISNTYLNYIGDPFTYIVNKNCYGSVVLNNKRNLVDQQAEGNVYKFGPDDIMPIGDGGATMVSLKKIKEIFGSNYADEEIVCSMTTLLLQKTQYIGCIPKDTIKHNSKATLKQYLNKQKFKINNNLYNNNAPGFASREKYSSRLKRRKLLFVVYCVCIIAPIVDSIRLALRFSDATMLMHFFYTYYILFEIVIGMIGKVLGKNKQYNYG